MPIYLMEVGNETQSNGRRNFSFYFLFLVPNNQNILNINIVKDFKVCCLNASFTVYIPV